eukprot:764978-Hanusia_phi.AAC.2
MVDREGQEEKRRQRVRGSRGILGMDLLDEGARLRALWVDGGPNAQPHVHRFFAPNLLAQSQQGGQRQAASRREDA